MKILLLTDIPPCKNFTAGLVLDQLCRFLPRGSIACFAMVNPALDAKLSPDLDWIPVAYARKRNEAAFWPSPARLLRSAIRRISESRRGRSSPVASSPRAWLARKSLPRLPGSGMLARPLRFPIVWAVEKLRRVCVVPRLTNQAVAFGRAQKVDVVWAVLQGQTVTQMAVDVARRLQAPLITQVWDPLRWWLLANKIDRFNQQSALDDFDQALRESRTCITASWAMAQAYQSRYSTRAIPVIASHPSEWARTPDLNRFPGDQLKLGMAGQFYAGEEWLQLLRALNMSGWQVRGRSVSLTVLGAACPPGDAPPDRIRYLGWRSQEEAVELLSALDLLYCPYPFDGRMEEVATLSFPSKVVLYLAAGRPVLFHGPDYASPAEYLRDRQAGYIVPDLHAAAVYNGLCRLVDDPELYVALGKHAQQAFLRDFTLESMRASFEQALEVQLDQIDDLGNEPVPPIHLPDVTAIIPGAVSVLVRAKKTADLVRRAHGALAGLLV